MKRFKCLFSIENLNLVFRPIKRSKSSYEALHYDKMLTKHQAKPIPGPKGLPMFGNLNQAFGKGGLPKSVWKLRKKYGNLYQMNFGKMSLVIVMGHRYIQEMLEERNSTFSGRPNWLYIPNIVFNRKGIIWTGREEWDKLQKLMLSTVHDKHRQVRLQDEIFQEFQVVSDRLRDSCGKPVYPEDHFWKAAFNVVSSFVFGSRFQHDDPELQKLQDTVQYVAVNSKTQNPEHLFPWSKAFTKSKITKLKQKNEEISQFLRTQFEIHQERKDKEQDEDFMDVFLRLSDEERKDPAYSEESIFKSIVDMYHGSMESVSGLLLWTVVYMCKFPDVQSKCQKELDQVLQSENFTLAHRSKIPYTEATAKEIMRICGVVPFSALHTNDADVTVGGFNIPRHSLLLFHLQSACMDRELWEKPREFRPERFLEEQVEENPAFKPFGYGPRSCKGADIASNTHLIFLASMLHKFKIVADKGRQPQFEGSYTGVTYRPHKFEVKFIARENT